MDISLTEENGRVRVWGPGIQRGGVLYRFQSHFFVDTTGAGAGELKVRIMGPKGGSRCVVRNVYVCGGGEGGGGKGVGK